jgi:hypothetical protein
MPFHDTTAILLVFGVDHLSTMFLEARERASVIHAHQPTIGGDIGGENGGDSAQMSVVTDNPHLSELNQAKWATTSVRVSSQLSTKCN